MIKLTTLCSLLMPVAILLLKPQGQTPIKVDKPVPMTSVEGHFATGRTMEAYEAAANYLRKGRGGKDGLTERATNIANYSIGFEGEKDGCFIFHFMPDGRDDDPDVLDMDFRNGLFVRFYVRAKDLKVIKAVLD